MRKELISVLVCSTMAIGFCEINLTSANVFGPVSKETL